MVRTVREDGFKGLFRGAGPTATRAMALNMGMLATNDQVRPCRVGRRAGHAGSYGGGVPATQAGARARGFGSAVAPARPARRDVRSVRPSFCRQRRSSKTLALRRAAASWCWGRP